MMQKIQPWLAFILLPVLLTGFPWQTSQAQGPEQEPASTALFTGGPEEPDPKESDRREYQWPALQMLAQPAAGPDAFGYTWSEAGEYQWYEVSDGKEVKFTNSDDAFSALIDIGFSFKFYENTYTQLYVSTNGLISFGKGTIIATNGRLGRDISPNNLIAVFWDDLIVETGNKKGVFYKYGQDSQRGDFLAVVWNQVHKIGLPDDLFTFQALLYQNGDIRVQYQQLGSTTDSASVGIEDAEGLTGLQYSFNELNLAAGKGILFVRPAPAARVKLMRRHASAFTESGKAAIPLQVRNTGELGEDRYTLAIENLSPLNWKISLYDAAGQTLLRDTNGDGQVDTGPLAQGATFSFVVKAEAPPGSTPGDYASFNLTARSGRDSSRWQVTALQFAVPASFAQFYVDSDLGIGLEQISANRRQTLVVDDWFSGSSLALAAQSTGGMVGIWELNSSSSGEMPLANLRFAWVSPTGILVRKQAELTNNLLSGQPFWSIADEYLSLAPAANGDVGITWLRTSIDFGNLEQIVKKNRIYFNRINAAGEVVLPTEIGLTPDDVWIGPEDWGKPELSSPRIAFLGPNRYFVAWFEERRLQNETSQETLRGGVFDENGKPVGSLVTLASNQPGQTTLTDLNLVSLSEGRALALFSRKDLDTQNYVVMAVGASSNGAVTYGPAPVPDALGWKPDALEMPGGRILLAWTSVTAGAGDGLRYTLLDGRSFQPVLGNPVVLQSPSDHGQDYLSVSGDAEGRGILTWMDAEGSSYLFYALVQEDGALLTPPMVFYPRARTGNTVGTNQTGQGSVRFKPSFPMYLPAVSR